MCRCFDRTCHYMQHSREIGTILFSRSDRRRSISHSSTDPYNQCCRTSTSRIKRARVGTLLSPMLRLQLTTSLVRIASINDKLAPTVVSKQ